MRVLHVVGSNWLAGTERHVLGLARELQLLGCDASLACPSSATVVIAEAEALGVPTSSWRASLRSRASIVHVHDGRSAVLGRVLARDPKVVLVRTQHFVRPASATRRGWRGLLSQALQSRLNARLDGYVAVSEAVKIAAVARRETRAAKVAVIPSGIRLPSASSVATALAWRASPEAPVVASAGRLEKERCFNVLLNAAADVRARQPGCQFVIAGAGSVESELKAMATRLGVDDAVRWTGWLADIGPVLMQSHVYVNTGRSEGFGMATAEAMAFSLPVVAMRSGATTELVDDGVTGRLVAPDDPQSLADAVVELIEDPSRASSMGERGRLRAANYSMQRVAASTLEFYGRLAAARAGH